jgi:hypothetical protein
MSTRGPDATTSGGGRARSLVAAAAPGATLISDRQARFSVWAPRATAVDIHLVTPVDRVLRLSPAGDGRYEAIADGVGAGARYSVRLDGGKEHPDPASRFQPEGVHGPSEVVATAGDVPLPGMPEQPCRWRVVIDSADATWLGPGSLVPARLNASASAKIRMQPYSSVVLERVA